MNTTKQPDQASHSPLPWSIDPQGYGTPWNIDSVNGEKVALCIEGIGGKAEARNARRSANADFIVRACNNAQRLADACKLWHKASLQPEGSKAQAQFSNAAALASREALAQWEGSK